MRAEILTPWSGKGTDSEPFRPLIGEVLQGRYADATFQPSEHLIPDPNLLLAEVECTSAALALVEADPRFFVIWSE